MGDSHKKKGALSLSGLIYPSVSIPIALKPATHTRISLSFLSLPPIPPSPSTPRSILTQTEHVHPQRICHQREQLDRAASVQGLDHRQCQGMYSRNPSFRLGRLAITNWLKQQRERETLCSLHLHTVPAMTNLGSRLSFPLNPLVFGSVSRHAYTPNSNVLFLLSFANLVIVIDQARAYHWYQPLLPATRVVSRQDLCHFSRGPPPGDYARKVPY